MIYSDPLVRSWACPESTAPLLQSGLVSCPMMWISSISRNSQLLYQMGGFVSRCNRTLAEATKDLPRNFTYSLMSFLQAHDLRNAAIPVTDTSRLNLFSYDATSLLATYVAVIIIVLLWIRKRPSLSGTMTSSATYLIPSYSLLQGTFTPTVRQRISLGLYTLPEDVYNVLFRFGQVNSELLTEHAAYGNCGAHYSSEMRRFYNVAMSRYCLIWLIIS